MNLQVGADRFVLLARSPELLSEDRKLRGRSSNCPSQFARPSYPRRLGPRRPTTASIRFWQVRIALLKRDAHTKCRASSGRLPVAAFRWGRQEAVQPLWGAQESSRVLLRGLGPRLQLRRAEPSRRSAGVRETWHRIGGRFLACRQERLSRSICARWDTEIEYPFLGCRF